MLLASGIQKIIPEFQNHLACLITIILLHGYGDVYRTPGSRYHLYAAMIAVSIPRGSQGLAGIEALSMDL